jgi:hypothetical protein
MTAPANPPKLTRPKYHVWLDPRPDLTADSPELDDTELEYHHVVVNAGDQLRAELEAKRNALGSPKDSPMHLTVLWLWAALVRTKRYDGKFQAFKLACISFDPDKPADADDTQDDVTPTEASTS